MKTKLRGATTCRSLSMLRRLQIPVGIGVLTSLIPVAVVRANPVVPFLNNVPENILYFFGISFRPTPSLWEPNILLHTC